MPTPAYFESRAVRLWPLRWWLGFTSFALFGVLFAALSLAGSSSRAGWIWAFALLVPASVWLWGLTVVAVWFHPSQGTARVGSPWFFRAPDELQTFFRWYASIFLAIWFLMPVPFVLVAAIIWAAA
jgi:hypothetical protein